MPTTPDFYIFPVHRPNLIGRTPPVNCNLSAGKSYPISASTTIRNRPRHSFTFASSHLTLAQLVLPYLGSSYLYLGTISPSPLSRSSPPGNCTCQAPSDRRRPRLRSASRTTVSHMPSFLPQPSATCVSREKCIFLSRSLSPFASVRGRPRHHEISQSSNFALPTSADRRRGQTPRLREANFSFPCAGSQQFPRFKSRSLMTD